MKLSKYVMLALAGLAFAACSNEDAEQNSLSNGKSVSISIANIANTCCRHLKSEGGLSGRRSN